jgi:hypothetical protein
VRMKPAGRTPPGFAFPFPFPFAFAGLETGDWIRRRLGRGLEVCEHKLAAVAGQLLENDGLVASVAALNENPPVETGHHLPFGSEDDDRGLELLTQRLLEPRVEIPRRITVHETVFCVHTDRCIASGALRHGERGLKIAVCKLTDVDGGWRSLRSGL